MAIFRAMPQQAAPRRRRPAFFRGLGDALSDSIMANLANWTRYPWSAVQDQGSGIFTTQYDGNTGREEIPGVIIFRTDAGSVTGYALRGDSAPAPQLSLSDALRQSNIAFLNARPDVLAQKIATLSQAWATNDPAYAAYWPMYGNWPSDPQSQFNWIVNVMTGGALEANRQDLIDESSGWEGFMNNTFPVLATSAILGSAIGSWAAATGAPAYGPVAAASDLINFGPDAMVPYGYGGAVDVAGDVAASVPADALDVYAPLDVADADVPPQIFDVNSADWTPVETAADESIPTITVSSPPLPAETVDSGVNVPPVIFDANSADWTPVDESQAAVTDEPIERVTITSPPATDAAGAQPGDVFVTPPGVIEPVDNFPGSTSSVAVVPGGSSLPGVGDVLKVALPIVSAGAGIYKNLTASDGLQVPYLPGTSALPGTTQPDTLSSFPWWILIALGLAAAGN